MLKRIVTIVVLVPLAVVLVMLSVANRASVTLSLNPFRPDDSVLSLTAPFFVFLFLALIVGMVLGSFATWLNQGRYRKRARSEAKAAVKWQAEADRQRTRAEGSGGDAASGRALPAPRDRAA